MDKQLLQIRNNVINDYKNQIEISKILEKYQLNWSKFYNLVAPSLRHNKKDVSQEEVNKILDLYQDGVSTTKIGVELYIHHKLISEILQDHNVDIHFSLSQRKYAIQESFFDSIDDQYKAYILGLLYADGYNNEQKGEIRLSLAAQDKDILLRINNLLHYDRPLSFQKCDDRIASNGYISKDMYILDIYSKHMSRMLSKWGVKQNKSLSLTFPTFLDNALIPHFLRGYFDGDGSFCHRYTEKYGRRDLVTFTSTHSFCLSAKEKINQLSLAKGGGIYDASCRNGITKVLSFSGPVQVEQLLNWLYNGADIFLNRKYQIYNNAFKQNYSYSA